MKTRKHSRVLTFVIVALIVLLAYLLFAPKVWTPGLRGKSQITKIQIKELEGALQLFRHDTGRYPTTIEGLDALVRDPGLASWRGPYVVKSEGSKDPCGRLYVYRCPGHHGAYDLFSCGSDGMEGGEGDGQDVTRWAE